MLLFLFRFFFFFFSSRRRHTRCLSDWSSDVCSSDLSRPVPASSDHDRWRLQCAKLSLLPTTSCRRTSPRHHESMRSEEHTSELQSLRHLVCRLLLEKKKKTVTATIRYRTGRSYADRE